MMEERDSTQSLNQLESTFWEKVKSSTGMMSDSNFDPRFISIGQQNNSIDNENNEIQINDFDVR